MYAVVAVDVIARGGAAGARKINGRLTSEGA
jgi:hypothetical protein